jgi:hypothetical protein
MGIFYSADCDVSRLCIVAGEAARSDGKLTVTACSAVFVAQS